MHQKVINQVLLKNTNKSTISFLNKNINCINYIYYRNFKSKSGNNQDEASKKRETDEVKKQQNVADGLTKFLVEAIAVQRVKLEWTEEEYAVVKRYNSLTSTRDTQEKKDLSTKVHLQQHALKNIPTEFLKNAAKVIDKTPPPDKRDRPIFHQPPPWSPYARLLINDEEVIKKYKEDQEKKKLQKQKQIEENNE